MAGGVLKLHPKIVVGNGAMNASKKYRGKIASVIMSYVKNMENDLKMRDRNVCLSPIPAVTGKQ